MRFGSGAVVWAWLAVAALHNSKKISRRFFINENKQPYERKKGIRVSLQFLLFPIDSAARRGLPLPGCHRLILLPVLRQSRIQEAHKGGYIGLVGDGRRERVGQVGGGVGIE